MLPSIPTLVEWLDRWVWITSAIINYQSNNQQKQNKNYQCIRAQQNKTMGIDQNENNRKQMVT